MSIELTDQLISLKRIWLLFNQWHLTVERASSGGRRFCVAILDAKVPSLNHHNDNSDHINDNNDSTSTSTSTEDGLHLLQRLANQTNINNESEIAAIKLVADRIFSSVVPLLWSK
jgi:hypothetical protein